MSEEINTELETFRKQWQEEVNSRSKGSTSEQGKKLVKPSGPPKSGGAIRSEQPPPTRSNEVHEASPDAQGHLELENKDEARKLGSEGEGTHSSNHVNRESSSALEHYEKAVERESQGNLGESLALYRKAYRLDSGVDRIYKNKHFPPCSSMSKPPNPNPSSAPVTVPNPAHHSLEGLPQSSLLDLIASFSSFSIAPAAPPEGSSPLPCPIATIPSELLVDILERTALADIASFARLSLVCKNLAYLIAVEDRLWKGVCLGTDYGFGAMHYKWNCTISGDPLPFTEDHCLSEDTEDLPSSSPSLSPSPPSFPLTPLYPSYKSMFQLRPRIRFGGCYISTVNYIRPGASTPSQISWNTPVHIVTYYRYLRFFRDGSCISLLTTIEPIEVVHHLTKEHLHTHHTGGLPSAVMNHALRGRWKLSSPSPPQEKEGTLHIETHGIDPEKYIYKMQLSVRSGRSTKVGTKNVKLIWDGFWSYNKLTDDWAEFGLRNDRPFWWSRVGSYGIG